MAGPEQHLWRLAVWYTTDRKSPMSLEDLASIYEALNSRKSKYRMPRSWKVTPAILTGNIADFLRMWITTQHLKYQNWQLDWLFKKYTTFTCPKCHTEQALLHHSKESTCRCQKCYEHLEVKDLGLPPGAW